MSVAPDDVSRVSHRLRALHSRLCSVPDGMSIALDYICEVPDDICPFLDDICLISDDCRVVRNDVRHAPDELQVVADEIRLALHPIRIAPDVIRVDLEHSSGVLTAIQIAIEACGVAKLRFHFAGSKNRNLFATI